ncbi:MAG TPA: hypothetical protein PK733_06110 [Clostridiales bacterium]|nr:hypothetical protein [Clostridiales bacterium]
MKKTKFLVLALAVAIMMMGAGYAAWSETLKLDATVNSTYLNIVLGRATETTYVRDTIDDSALEGYGTKCKVYLYDNAGGANTNSSRAEVYFVNLFPGIKQKATITYKNDSKIPVKLTKVVYSQFTDNGLLTASIPATVMLQTVNMNNGSWPLQSLAGKTYTHNGEGSTPVINPEVVLQPGEVMTYIIEIELPIESENDSQLKNLSFDVTTTFEQL